MEEEEDTYEVANAHGLTAIELAELEKAEEIRKGKARAATSEDIEEDEDEQGFLVLDSPPPFPARAGESQGGTTITISPPPVHRPPPLVSSGPPSPPPRSPSLPVTRHSRCPGSYALFVVFGARPVRKARRRGPPDVSAVWAAASGGTRGWRSWRRTRTPTAKLGGRHRERWRDGREERSWEKKGIARRISRPAGPPKYQSYGRLEKWGRLTGSHAPRIIFFPRHQTSRQAFCFGA
jgi:hypothetical protein